MVLGNWTATHKRMKLDHSFTLYTKINWKWIKDINVKQEILKILEESTVSKYSDISHSNIFLDNVSWGKAKRSKNKHWDCLNVKSFCTTKKTINKTKIQPTEWRRHSQITHVITGLYPKYIKNL